MIEKHPKRPRDPNQLAKSIVDIAIISKSEGFVWTKRKHYFPKELNPRFFVRHYPEATP